MRYLLLIALVFTGLAAFRATRLKVAWAWWLFAFWALLAIAIGTGWRVLLLPAAAALVWAFLGRLRAMRRRAELVERVNKARVTIAGEKEARAAAKAAGTAAALPGDDVPPPAPPGEPIADWVETGLRLDGARAYPTEDGARLRLEPGAYRVAFRLRYRPERAEPREEEIDAPLLAFRLADSSGRVWQSETYLRAFAFSRPFEPDASGEELTFWDRAPSSWVGALAERCLLAGAVCLLDSREIYEVSISGEPVTLQLKYQGPVLDLAWLDTPGRLLVRVHSLYHRQDTAEHKRIATLPAFAYTLRPEEFLPPTAAEFHWQEWDEWWDEPGEGEKKPFLFAATGSTAAPQPGVEVEAG